MAGTFFAILLNKAFKESKYCNKLLGKQIRCFYRRIKFKYRLKSRQKLTKTPILEKVTLGGFAAPLPDGSSDSV